MQDNFQKILEFEAMVCILKSNKQEIESSIKSYQKRIDSLKEDVISYMKENGVLTEHTKTHSWSLRKSPQSVLVKSLDNLPVLYKRIKVEPAKKFIKQAIKEGKVVEGAILVDGKDTLTCRVKSIA